MYIIPEIRNKILQGHTLEILKKIPDNSVDTIITSPPYWGLRDYGKEVSTVWDGDKNCEHQWNVVKKKDPNFRNGSGQFDGKGNIGAEMDVSRIRKEGFCSKCGAWYGQLGLEPSLELFLEHTLQITNELKRILKETGVMFWNMGDCYNSTKCGLTDEKRKEWLEKGERQCSRDGGGENTPEKRYLGNMEQKCLVMQNERLVIKMIDNQNWILRNRIIWYKPNHMPSSVQDRFANSYEPVYMFVKNKIYNFDLDAVRILTSDKYVKGSEFETKYGNPYDRFGKNTKKSQKFITPEQEKEAEIKTGRIGGSGRIRNFFDNSPKINNPYGKNPGDVWKIPTQAFSDAHFATFPEKLLVKPILSSCPKEICKECGSIRKRIIKIHNDNPKQTQEQYKEVSEDKESITEHQNYKLTAGLKIKGSVYANHETLGWTKCGCEKGWDKGIVLDPFCGSGTTCVVARKLNRDFIGIEISEKYIQIAKQRLKGQLQPLF